MKTITQSGVGINTHDESLRDTFGTGLLPVQVRVASGNPTWRLLGRVVPDAPWVELRPAQTGGMLETISWCPYVAVEITSGSGALDVWIGER